MNEKNGGGDVTERRSELRINAAAEALRAFEGQRVHVQAGRPLAEVICSVVVEGVEVLPYPRDDDRRVLYVRFERDNARTPSPDGEPYSENLGLRVDETDLLGYEVVVEWFGAVELTLVARFVITFWPTADADPTPRGLEPGR